MPSDSTSFRSQKSARLAAVVGAAILCIFGGVLGSWVLLSRKEDSARLESENKKVRDEMKMVQADSLRQVNEVTSQLSAKQEEINNQKKAVEELRSKLVEMNSELSGLKAEQQKNISSQSALREQAAMSQARTDVGDTKIPTVTERPKSDFTNAAIPEIQTVKWQAVRIANATQGDIHFFVEDLNGVRHEETILVRKGKGLAVRNSRFLVILDQSERPGIQEKRYVLKSNEFDQKPSQSEENLAPETEVYVVGTDSAGYAVFGMRQTGR